MRLTIVGCTGSVVGAQAPASCYLLQSGEQRPILIDIGNGAMGVLQTIVNPSDCDLVLSHMHPDHCSDISSLIVWRRYSALSTNQRGVLLAPYTALQRIGCWFADEAGTQENLTDTFDHRPWQVGETYHLNGFTVQVDRADHPGECYCLRFTEDATGLTLCFSGDTADCPGLRAMAQGVDVFLCEATWDHSEGTPQHMHLTGRQAAEVASAAEVKQLLLTHIPPWTSRERIARDAGEVATMPVELVTQGAVYEW